MKPVKTTIEHEQEEQRRVMCDQVLSQAILHMQDKIGASFEEIADRMFTYAAGMSFKMDGKAHTVAQLRQMAKNIEKGALDELAFSYGQQSR